MNDEFHSMISMYFFDFAIVDKPLNIRLQSVVPVRGGEKTYRGREWVLSVSFCFHNCKAIIVNRRSEKKGKTEVSGCVAGDGNSAEAIRKTEVITALCKGYQPSS